MTNAAGNMVLASKMSTIIDNLGLTQEEVGQIVNASARTIARWSTGEVVPQRLSKQKLLELAYVADAVTEIMPRERANFWMLSPNKLLSHDSPAERIQAGNYKDVLDLIEGLAEGIVV